MMGWFDAKKEHGKGLYHSDYKSDDYKEKQRKKEEEEERERKRKEKEKYDREVQQSMDMGNKGKKKSSWW
jgi:hypothetical protein